MYKCVEIYISLDERPAGFRRAEPKVQLSLEATEIATNYTN